MFVPKEDRIRHKLLQIVTEKIAPYLHKSSVDQGFVCVKTKDAAKMLSLSEMELSRIAEILVSQDELMYIKDEDFDFAFISSTNTSLSYHGKKYLKKGKEHFISRTKDYLTIVAQIMAITIAIVTIITSIVNTIQNRTDIKALREEVRALQQKIQSAPRH